MDAAFEKLTAHLGLSPTPKGELVLPAGGGRMMRVRDSLASPELPPMKPDDWAAEARRTLMLREWKKRADAAAPHVQDLIAWATMERWNSCAANLSGAQKLLDEARRYAQVLGAADVRCVPDSADIVSLIADGGPGQVEEGWLSPDQLKASAIFAAQL